MLYAKAIDGSPEAARFLSPDNTRKASDIVMSLMEKKLNTYLKFNETYPGFGGSSMSTVMSTDEHRLIDYSSVVSDQRHRGHSQ